MLSSVDLVSDKCAERDVWSHNEDTNARKKMEMITQTVKKRPKKIRTREGGTKCGKSANESEEADEP